MSGSLLRIIGRAAAANLPAQVPRRMVKRATALLQPLGTDNDVRPECLNAACAGAGIFMLAEYQQARAGFWAALPLSAKRPAFTTTRRFVRAAEMNLRACVTPSIRAGLPGFRDR